MCDMSHGDAGPHTLVDSLFCRRSCITRLTLDDNLRLGTWREISRAQDPCIQEKVPAYFS